MTPTQLQRIRDGARLCAFPMGVQPHCEPRVEWQPQHGRVAALWHEPDGTFDFCLCPHREGAPIDPYLPGLTWGKSRVVRRSEVSPEEIEACGFHDRKTWTGVFYSWEGFSRELGDADWLWLTEVRPQVTAVEEPVTNQEGNET